jgi:hypothetical protein
VFFHLASDGGEIRDAEIETYPRTERRAPQVLKSRRMAGAHNLSRAHNNIGIVVPDYQASGFLLNRTELLDPEAEDVAIEKFTLLQIGNREGEDKTHRTDISMSILML